MNVSDKRLRDLERRFRESGTIEDKLAWIHERLRTKDITREKVQIAAFFKDPACLQIEPIDCKDDMAGSRWVRSVPSIRTDELLSLRVALSAAQFVYPHFLRVRPNDQRLKRAMLFARGFVYDRRDRRYTQRRVYQLMDEINILLEALDDTDRTIYRVRRHKKAACAAANTVSATLYLIVALFDQNLGNRLRYTGSAVGQAVSATNHEYKKVSPKLVKEHIGLSLIPWALGYKDPLLDLVAQLEATPTQD